ncbi:sigma-54 dependent transcriptional regulator [Stieleria sp. TO1_6]|uniref:sigma-54-dependent transcriptional regulator n=1 Tax=Stieleria tagensis TaxID=2956795 RepID=UPI00209AC1AA|nr:sigma-54 dependent transcriptional regulator [Stieleria tagensis]MCO8121709.1 sigma-54 dependent transcriptional regulator [Stieleria tagensis]
MTKVLVVDDDPMVQRLITAALETLGLQVHSASSADTGLKAIETLEPDVLFLDVKLPDVSGLELTETIHSLDPKLPIVFITVSDDSNIAIEAMTVGAYDFLLKPLDMAKVQEVTGRAVKARRMMQVPVRMVSGYDDVAETDGDQDAMIGRSASMLEVYKDVGRVAKQEVTVLICGESGTGKELVARAVYQHSLRADKPFLAVNCAALSETLLESELFGHEKGAFTGADQRRVGKFEQCDGGTLFLDEVGDMAPAVQGKVLRLLQEQTFERVGGRETIQTDVRIISATNRDFDQMIADGEFRLDLYHRLNGYRIDLPPLRDRAEDRERLIEYLLVRYSRETGKVIQGIAPEASELLQAYHWPGNIREMQSVIRKAVLKASGPVLLPDTLPDAIVGDGPSDHSGTGQDGALPTESSPPTAAHSDLATFVDQRRRSQSTDLYAETLEMMERYLIARVLQESGGNQSKAAADLGISRGSLRNKIRTYGLSVEHHVSPDGDADEQPVF